MVHLEHDLDRALDALSDISAADLVLGTVWVRHTIVRRLNQLGFHCRCQVSVGYRKEGPRVTERIAVMAWNTDGLTLAVEICRGAPRQAVIRKLSRLPHAEKVIFVLKPDFKNLLWKQVPGLARVVSLEDVPAKLRC